MTSTALDLAVNSASERGLLSIALHPGFRNNGWVYLFWTEASSGLDSTALDDVQGPAPTASTASSGTGSTLTYDRDVAPLPNVPGR